MEKAGRLASIPLLQWWKERESDFPLMAAVAPRFLCVQASSAASERCFSYAGHILTLSRTRMKPDTLHKLSFLHANRDLLLKDGVLNLGGQRS